MRQAGYTHKVASHFHHRRSHTRKAQYLIKVADIPYQQMVFVDETGVQLRHSRRKYGWGIVNKRVHIRYPPGLDTGRYSIVASMTSKVQDLPNA